MAGFARPGFGPLIVTPQSEQVRPITRRFGFGTWGHRTSLRSCTHHGLSLAIRTGLWPECQGLRRRPSFPSLRQPSHSMLRTGEIVSRPRNHDAHPEGSGSSVFTRGAAPGNRGVPAHARAAQQRRVRLRGQRAHVMDAHAGQLSGHVASAGDRPIAGSGRARHAESWGQLPEAGYHARLRGTA